MTEVKVIEVIEYGKTWGGDEWTHLRHYDFELKGAKEWAKKYSEQEIAQIRKNQGSTKPITEKEINTYVKKHFRFKTTSIKKCLNRLIELDSRCDDLKYKIERIEHALYMDEYGRARRLGD